MKVERKKDERPESRESNAEYPMSVPPSLRLPTPPTSFAKAMAVRRLRQDKMANKRSTLGVRSSVAKAMADRRSFFNHSQGLPRRLDVITVHYTFSLSDFNMRLTTIPAMNPAARSAAIVIPKITNAVKRSFRAVRS